MYFASVRQDGPASTSGPLTVVQRIEDFLITGAQQPGTTLTLNLLPEMVLAEVFIQGKGSIKKNLGNVLSQWLPARLVDGWLGANGFQADARPHPPAGAVVEPGDEYPR